MGRLSEEFLEKIAIEQKSTSQQVRNHVNRELRLLVEEIAKRYTK